jgi:hypothetical protein
VFLCGENKAFNAKPPRPPRYAKEKNLRNPSCPALFRASIFSVSMDPLVKPGGDDY